MCMSNVCDPVYVTANEAIHDAMLNLLNHIWQRKASIYCCYLLLQTSRAYVTDPPN